MAKGKKGYVKLEGPKRITNPLNNVKTLQILKACPQIPQKNSLLGLNVELGEENVVDLAFLGLDL